MPPQIVLEIIKLSLEIWLQILKDMPEAERQRAWEDWAKWRHFWEGLLPKP